MIIGWIWGGKVVDSTHGTVGAGGGSRTGMSEPEGVLCKVEEG
jgi:hypothetical protein